jgi:uncharacterized protein with ParB-like and HNH nuclease domain
MNVGMITFSFLCRAFSHMLISYIFYQKESDDDAIVKEQMNDDGIRPEM